MKKAKHSLLPKLFALSGLLLFLTSSASAWRFSLPSPSRAESVVVDAAGDIIAAGRAYYGGEVVKLSGTTGELLWQFNASHNQTEQGVNSIALDSHGDVFVLIGTYRGVIKVSGVTGEMIWQGNIGGSTAGCQNRFNAIVVDRKDNVVAAGTAGCLFNVAKLDGTTGVERWHYEHEGYAKAVAVDPFGNVAAAGLINRNFGTVKLRGDNGAELWEREINGAGNFTDAFEEANAVAMDKDGSVVVAGVTSNEVGNSRDFTVARYLSDGSPQWTQIIDGLFRVTPTGNDASNDIANAVAIDKDGSVIAAGSVQESLEFPRSPEPEHFHVIKISQNGSVVWSRPAEDPVPQPPGEPEYIRGYAFSLSVNAAGNVVAGGVNNGRFTLVKFWGRTGGRAWRRQLTSGTDPSMNGNQALRVVMDAASDVVAAGETLDPAGFSQFTVVKLRRIDGLDYSADPTPPAAPETVVKYAPVVYLHSADDFRPDDPMTFIRGSELKWSHQATVICIGEDHEDAARGTVDISRLGAAHSFPYSHSPLNHASLRCRDYGDDMALKATDYTRPFDGSKRDNILGELKGYMKEGYYLNPDDDNNELRNGIQSGPSVFPGAPVFYEYVPYQYVAYWFFYPYDKFEIPSFPNQEHEGDWERVSVQLDRNDQLVQVFYYHHDNGMLRSPESLEFEGTHPVVYSAKGSHGSYPNARDDYATKIPLLYDHTDRGPRWSTWDNLLKVESQLWYGFGGAWGEVGELPEHLPFPIFDQLSGSDWTGPLGPSPYKRSFDRLLDTIPPLLNLPANISVNADIPQGARVYFTVTATDDATQNPRIACTSQPGSLFPIGTTTVACTATDGAGNSANGVFNIIVKGAGEQIIDLKILVKHFNFPKGTENSLLAKLQNAFTKLTRGDNAGACNELRAFISEVQAQSGKKISLAQANQMVTAANRIRAVIGCR